MKFFTSSCAKTQSILGARTQVATLIAVFLVLLPLNTFAQQPAPALVPQPETSQEMVQLDFSDVELAALIDTIARLTGRNFIYDDRVRGRITIVSPSPVTVDQAYAVFESVLKVKGFTAVPGPGGITKVIPLRDAKESNLQTFQGASHSPNRDLFVTHLIPLDYIDAESITNTIKPLVSKDASMVPYPPTNTIIITDTSANIQRVLTILDAIDIETHKEELAVIKILHADAVILGQQVAEIYEANVSTQSRRPARSRRQAGSAAAAASVPSAQRSPIRIITDERTNSLLVLASRSQLVGIRQLVRQLDVPVVGSGRIHVYYLKHSDAEELSQTLNSLLQGQTRTPTAGRSGGAAAAPQALRSAITELSEGITITADPATNSLVIQASKEAYETLSGVIGALDIARPQVLVEALIMEIDLSDSLDLGFTAAIQYINANLDLAVNTAATGLTAGIASFPIPSLPGSINDRAGVATPKKGLYYDAIIKAAATDGNINILSAPHILTSDNEEAEIRVGDNIPIITSRVDAATGGPSLSASVNVERKDIGVTLRVTPQISEGNMLRLKIFQEITQVNEALTKATGSADQVGVALSNRQVDNTVVVADGETVVIGGLIQEKYAETVDKVPWLGDIPFLGWAFKTTSETTDKRNLLIFLTPHIIRSLEDMEYASVRKREEFEQNSGELIHRSDVIRRSDEMEPSPIRRNLIRHQRKYPQDRMREIEVSRAEFRARVEAIPQKTGPQYMVRAGLFGDEREAARTLTRLVDSGYDGTLVAEQTGGNLFFEIHVGPYSKLEDARQATIVLREAYSLDPTLTILEEETP